MLITASPIYAADKIQVVASFSILADICKNIGQDKIDVHTIININSDAHSFEPTPTNVKQLARADLLVYNGLNFESWLDRLKQAAGFNALEVIASQGIKAIANNENDEHEHEHEHEHAHNHGKYDPHAWQSLDNGIIYAKNIAAALIQIDPSNADFYQQNTNNYINKLKDLDTKIKTALATIPKANKVVLTTHDSFAYFANSYGVNFISITGVSSAEEPSAKRIANIIATIKQNHVSAIFLEQTINNSVLKQITQETNSRIGGNLYSDTLASDNIEANTYLGMFNWNAQQIIKALKAEND